MELVFKSNDYNEAHDVLRLLEENGIPAQYSENSLRNRGTHIPDGNEVRIYLNTQYQEAIQLLKDPTYKVNKPVDIEEFYNTLESKDFDTHIQQYKKAFIKYGVSFILVFIVLIYLFIKSKT